MGFVIQWEGGLSSISRLLPAQLLDSGVGLLREPIHGRRRAGNKGPLSRIGLKRSPRKIMVGQNSVLMMSEVVSSNLQEP